MAQPVEQAKITMLQAALLCVASVPLAGDVSEALQYEVLTLDP